jgi:hypothetical protein
MWENPYDVFDDKYIILQTDVLYINFLLYGTVPWTNYIAGQKFRALKGRKNVEQLLRIRTIHWNECCDVTQQNPSSKNYFESQTVI